MSSLLYLGSTSQSRQMLLREAHIPFVLVAQSADETKCDWGMTLQQVVQHIALYKMEQVIVPQAKDGDICFVLTADTLTENSEGKLEGKPVNRDDAIEKLKKARNGVRTGTSFCLERRLFNQGAWHVQEHMTGYAQAHYQFYVPDELIDYYLDNVPVIGSGAIAIEGFGNQFLRSMDGSYSAVVGLPMFEVRQALQNMGFIF